MVLDSVLVLLAAAVAAVALCRALKLPALVGYLATGLALGPHAFAVASNAEETQSLAELGVVFLMFSIGLEFSLAKLHAMRRVVFGLGGAQVGGTLLLALAAALALGMQWQAGLALGAIAAPALSSRLSPERLFPWALLPLVVLLPAAGTQDLSQLLAAWLAAGVTVSVASLAARSLARAPVQEGTQPELETIPGVAASSGLLLGVGAARLLGLGFDVVSVLVLATALVLLAAGTARFLLLGSQERLGDPARS